MDRHFLFCIDILNGQNMPYVYFNLLQYIFSFFHIKVGEYFKKCGHRNSIYQFHKSLKLIFFFFIRIELELS